MPDDLEQRRHALRDALSQRKPPRDDAAKDQQDTATGFGKALKMSSEFVAGILVGAGLGYLVDIIAGTAPWGMIIFLMLGFAAGVLNVMRAAGVVAEPQARMTDSDDGSGPSSQD